MKLLPLLLTARLVAITIVVPEKSLAKLRAVTIELAHAYHDQVLGFEEPRVTAVWKKFCDSGKYKSVLTSPGHQREHYGLTNQKEFFAALTFCEVPIQPGKSSR